MPRAWEASAARSAGPRPPGLAAAAFALLAPLALAGPAALAQVPFAPEPPGLWPGPMHSATPATLAGATVLDADGLTALVARDRPVLVDVANAEPKPDAIAAAGWMPVHRSVPGAIWLPGAGTGKDRPGFADAFAERVRVATAGDKEKPVAVFCHAQRWGSWNAAKRLVELGYRHVYWYPGGSEGWGDKASMRAVREDPSWQAAGFDASSAGDMPDTPDKPATGAPDAVPPGR